MNTCILSSLIRQQDTRKATLSAFTDMDCGYNFLSLYLKDQHKLHEKEGNMFILIKNKNELQIKPENVLIFMCIYYSRFLYFLV